MKRIINILILFFLSLSGFGQNNFRSTGTIEMGGEIGLSSLSSSKSGETQVTISSNLFFGFMISPGLELGLRPGFTLRNESGHSYKIYNLFFNPAYNFNTSSNVYPYLGAILGINSIGYDNENYSGLGLGAEVGIKINLNGNSMFLIKFEYLSQNYTVSNIGFGQSGDEKINNVSIGAGFRIFLEKNQKH